MVKAARYSQFGGPEVLEIVDRPNPHPGPGQVRIAVRAAAEYALWAMTASDGSAPGP